MSATTGKQLKRFAAWQAALWAGGGGAVPRSPPGSRGGLGWRARPHRPRRPGRLRTSHVRNGFGRGPNGSGRGANLSTKSTATPAAGTPPKATAGGAPGATPGNPSSPRRSVSPPAAVATLGKTETTRGAGCGATRAH